MRQALGEYEDHDDGYGLIGEERLDDQPARDRRLPMMLLTICVMALFAGGLYFAYVTGTHHPAGVARGGDGVPLLRADEHPTKVKPDQPGGMTIPDQNVSLYNEKTGGPPVEKLLPAPEQPMPRPAAPPPAAETPSAPVPDTAAAGSPAPIAAGTAPASGKEPAMEGRGGPFQLRLGSLRTPEAAREEWAKLKRENPDLLGKLTAVAIRTDLGDKGVYYRIQAGSFGDQAEAERLCGALKRRNLGCILAR